MISESLKAGQSTMIANHKRALFLSKAFLALLILFDLPKAMAADVEAATQSAASASLPHVN
jgi:hypothetical protein